MAELWERARRLAIATWGKTAARKYDWMDKGKGAEKPIWAQVVYEEAARGKGLFTASILFDLVNAFEQVALNQVWEQGIAMGMPADILILEPEACAFGRRLTYKGMVSKTSSTLSAALAGGGFAADLLFVTLVKGVDEMMRRSETAKKLCTTRAFMIVDDVRVELEGPARAVARGASRIVEDAIEISEGQMHMELSRDKGQNEGKTVAQASEKELRRSGATAMSKFGVKVKENVRNLGVDFAAGGMSGTRGRNVLKARAHEGARRVKRAVVVGARGRRRVVRSMV